MVGRPKYKTSDLKKQALEAIQKHRLFFIQDVVAYLPCARSTFYEHFPDESDYRKELNEAPNKNCIEVKASMRSKWYKSESAALQLALYKLICTPEERRALSMQHQEISAEVTTRQLIIE